jgi:hypothetical protein
MKNFVKYILQTIFGIAFSIWILLEEIFWDKMLVVVDWSRKRAFVIAVEEKLKKVSSPWVAVICFCLPTLALLPFNFSGGWLIKHGHYASGVAILLLMKMVGTIIFAHLFAILKFVLFKWQWFQYAYNTFVQYKNMAIEFAKDTLIYKLSKRLSYKIKVKSKECLSEIKKLFSK